MKSIINTHSKRVSAIIQNILDLSRHRQELPERFDAKPWLEEFFGRLGNSYQHPIAVNLVGAHEPVQIRFNTSQFEQLLTNLCDNGLRYSHPPANCPHLVLEAGTDSSTQQPFIKVIDFGDGISKENLTHLFEPFFTTENTGSGLGLYICKELCESNQALISYEHTQEGLSCFHIHLAHPDKTL